MDAPPRLRRPWPAPAGLEDPPASALPTPPDSVPEAAPGRLPGPPWWLPARLARLLPASDPRWFEPGPLRIREARRPDENTKAPRFPGLFGRSGRPPPPGPGNSGGPGPAAP